MERAPTKWVYDVNVRCKMYRCMGVMRPLCSRLIVEPGKTFVAPQYRQNLENTR